MAGSRAHGGAGAGVRPLALARLIWQHANGQFEEIHEPLSAYERWPLVQHETPEPLQLTAETDENGVASPLARKQKARARLSRFYFRDRVAPPTLNLDAPDPELDLLHVTDWPMPLRETPGRAPHALSTSFGFGGHNACIVLGGAA